MAACSDPNMSNLRNPRSRWPAALALLGLVACQPTPNTLDRRASVSTDARLCQSPSVTEPSPLLHSALRRVAHPQGGRAAQNWIELGRSWLAEAQTRADPGLLLQARACAAAARQRQPDLPDALEIDAAVALASHDFATALQLADRLLQADRSHAAALGLRADALLELGRYREAAQAVRAQMAAWPGAAAQARAAWLQWLHGDVEGAKQALVAALRGRDGRNPAFDAWLWTEAAQLYWQTGDNTGAETLFLQALRVQPGFAPALLGQARIRLARGEWPASLRLADVARAAGAGFEAAVLHADVLALAGDRKAAEAAWQAAADLARRSDPVALARFQAERGHDVERALSVLLRAYAERPTLQLEAALSWAYWHLRQCPEARRHADRALRMGTREARWWFLDAQVSRRCGDPIRAERQLAAALALQPAFDPWLERQHRASTAALAAREPE